MPDKKTTKKKTTVKKTTARKPAAKVKRVVEATPKIRIQKISGLAAPTGNKDLVVDLKSRFKSEDDLSSKKRPPMDERRPVKSFYSEEEDDSLDDVNDGHKFEDNNDIDDDLEYEDEDEDDGLSLGTIDDDVEQKKVDYASKENLGKNNRRELIESLYRDEKKKSAAGLDSSAGKIYRKLAVTFVILVILIAGVVFYYATVKSTIYLTVKEQSVSDKLTVRVLDSEKNKEVPADSVAGVVKEILVEKSKTYPVEGTEVIGEEVIGKVTIYNKNNKSQPLVATTRLLSASGKLYRLRNAINIPAGAQVETEIYADQPSKDNVIGAEKLTFPGLWEGMQDKVYAESKDGDIKYGQETKKVITQEQIDKANEDIKKELFDKAKADINNTYSETNQRVVKLLDNTVTSTIDSKVGEEKSQFTVSMKATVQMVAFSGDTLNALATKKLQANLSSGRTFVGLNNDNITYEVASVDGTAGTAEVNMIFAGTISIENASGLVDKQKLVNLNESQLGAYFGGIPEIKDYRVDFFPSFIKKTPGLVDRIQLEIVR